MSDMWPYLHFTDAEHFEPPVIWYDRHVDSIPVPEFSRDIQDCDFGFGNASVSSITGGSQPMYNSFGFPPETGFVYYEGQNLGSLTELTNGTGFWNVPPEIYSGRKKAFLQIYVKDQNEIVAIWPNIYQPGKGN